MSDWTVDTLKEHFESKLQSVKESAELALEAAQRAADKADQAFEKRMDNTNEWRKSFEDLIGKFVTKEQVRWAFTALISSGLLFIAAYAANNQ